MAEGASDGELLLAWRAGDEGAGQQLYRRHFDAIFGFFRNKTDGADASDLVQKTFLTAVESKDRIENVESVRTFLFGIARRHLYRYWRNKKRDANLDFDASSVCDLDPSPSSLLEAKRERRVLLQALRKIPLDLQVALELYFWESLTGPELAAVLEIPVGTVRSRLRRGVEALRRAVGELGAEALESTQDDLDRWALRVSETARAG